MLIFFFFLFDLIWYFLGRGEGFREGGIWEGGVVV